MPYSLLINKKISRGFNQRMLIQIETEYMERKNWHRFSGFRESKVVSFSTFFCLEVTNKHHRYYHIVTFRLNSNNVIQMTEIANATNNSKLYSLYLH